jgi:putative transposase
MPYDSWIAILFEEVEVNRQIQTLVDLGKMHKSASEYACRVTLPMTKDGSQRFCGDYCPLNHQTRRDSFPMPLIEDVLNKLGHSKWFLALDLQSRFWQIPMAPDDVKKTTMITKSGLYEWNVMPFGLKNATSTFSQTMVEIFKEWTNQFVKVFVDDVNIHRGTWNEHSCHIRLVLQKIKGVNLKLNPSKCCFGSKSITFLGHIVDNA